MTRLLSQFSLATTAMISSVEITALMSYIKSKLAASFHMRDAFLDKGVNSSIFLNSFDDVVDRLSRSSDDHFR
ncbi:hypothetical protein SCHPADRAFT_341306 [Schizopora paradoxa]|uniref:Uncharacterized protein n=1 Tax=Schizopora paradoxa TaxID=27342 RepID=A0A0H2RQQ3_9AGAM|nr:hypothetical protein SCHPADRAFT_341306 [Schizopora paradoxa]